jgi:uncharacterized protein
MFSGVLPGPFSYAERWDEAAKAYRGFAIEKSLNVPVVVDSESVIIMPNVALAYISAQAPMTPVGSPLGGGDGREKPAGGATGSSGSGKGETSGEKLPTRFVGTVMISSERPAREIHQIVEAIIDDGVSTPALTAGSAGAAMPANPLAALFAPVALTLKVAGKELFRSLPGV